MDEELGYSTKTMHISYGDMEEKILSMYAKGMVTGDIESHGFLNFMWLLVGVQIVGLQYNSLAVFWI